MRILMLASGDLWAGAEVMVYQLCCGLQDYDGVELLVILLNPGRLADDLITAGIKVHIVDEIKLSSRDVIRKIYRISREFSPHLVHSHRYKENIIAWLVAKFMRKVVLVATQHGMPEKAEEQQGVQCLLRGLRTKFFFRLLSHCFDRAVFVSEEMRKSLVGLYGFREKNVTVIHNGIPLPSVNVLNHHDSIIVGSAGRLFPVKDYSLFIEIAKIVVSENNKVDFVLAGDGPERSLLEEKVAKYGLQERFRFLGHQDNMEDFYKSIDIYINTSVHEGIPMSVLEAMSFRLPVVVPDVGGFPEIIEGGISGFLVQGREPRQFAEKIICLLPEDCRRRIAIAARQRVEDSFSREAMVKQYYNVYLDVVDV